ncbi:hypothetical protein CARUB_v10006143mg [Capsella rubella]|uniref:Uncharacterized protein n=1 Tax=Capsella rubella TaxID=81985 RepID=R0GZK4_9BRAS|nr:uncharacterized protein LOC17879581 [Capsella rubella]EOA17755.1 hypothetical protein CARUB_v10006143mg [Capsella rubella]
MVRQRRKTEKEEVGKRDEVEKIISKKSQVISRKNMQSLVIGLVGATLTLGAYSQTFVSSSQSLGVGLFVLFLGLLVSEGFISF